MASWELAGNAALVASLASISVNALIVGRVARVPRLVRTTLVMVVVLVVTGCAALVGQRLLDRGDRGAGGVHRAGAARGSSPAISRDSRSIARPSAWAMSAG